MKINEAFYRLQGRDSYETRNHVHPEIEFIQCIQGSGMVLMHNRSFPLREHYLYLIDASQPHIVHPVDCDHYIRNKIVVDGASFVRFCEETGMDAMRERLQNLMPVYTGNHPGIDRLFQIIQGLFAEGSELSMGFAHGYLLQLLHFGFEQGKMDLTQPQGYVGEIVRMIEASETPVRLEVIAEKLHLSKCYVSHLFKRETGVSLSVYIGEKQYEKSMRYLRDTDLSMEAVAAACGFSAASSFTRFFKEKSGISPKQYRKGYKQTSKVGSG